MKVTFSALHFDATPKLQLFATKEIEKLDKYFDGDIAGEIILKEDGNIKVTEMRLNMLGKLLPVKIEGDDFYKLIPKAVGKLRKQMKSQKSKMYSR